jgi:hypothetical protein
MLKYLFTGISTPQNQFLTVALPQIHIKTCTLKEIMDFG